MKKKLNILINILVVILLIYLYNKLDINVIISQVKSVPIRILVVLVSIQIADMLLVNYQNYRLSRSIGYKLSFWKMNYITSIGHFFDGVTPGGGVGGEAVKIMMLKKHADIPLSSGTAIVISQKTISACSMLFLSLIGFFYLAATTLSNMSIFLKILINVGLVMILICVVYIFYHPRPFIKKCEKIKRNKIRETLIKFLESIEQISSNKKECAIEILISFAVWAMYPLKLSLLLSVSNVEIGFIAVYAIIFLSYATAMLPIFPGGMLGFEVSMTSLLALYGIARDNAFFITTLFRFFTFWFVIVTSIIYIGAYKIYTIIKKTTTKRNLA